MTSSTECKSNVDVVKETSSTQEEETVVEAKAASEEATQDEARVDDAEMEVDDAIQVMACMLHDFSSVCAKA